MSQHKISINFGARPICRFQDMKEGQFGIVRDSQSIRDGDIVLRGYDTVVSLENPQATWDTGNPTKVQILPDGTCIHIVVGAGKEE